MGFREILGVQLHFYLSYQFPLMLPTDESVVKPIALFNKLQNEIVKQVFIAQTDG